MASGSTRSRGPGEAGIASEIWSAELGPFRVPDGGYCAGGVGVWAAVVYPPEVAGKRRFVVSPNAMFSSRGGGFGVRGVRS
jgi:hypothetical protein